MQEIKDILLILLLRYLPTVFGNLISIGPGLYQSNHTLDGSTRAIYVLKSCEFMHNGRLHSVHFYTGSSDWLALEIWRPIGGNHPTGRMELIYQKNVETKTSHDTFQILFDADEVHVKSGDILGFTKLNDSFPISYVFHPLQSVDIWYHNIDLNQDYSQIGDVIDFEEMGFPYRFSVTVRFWADIPPVNGIISTANTEDDDSYQAKSNKGDKNIQLKDKTEQPNKLQYRYNTSAEDLYLTDTKSKRLEYDGLLAPGEQSTTTNMDAKSQKNITKVSRSDTSEIHEYLEKEGDYQLDNSTLSSLRDAAFNHVGKTESSISSVSDDRNITTNNIKSQSNSSFIEAIGSQSNIISSLKSNDDINSKPDKNNRTD